VGGYRRLVLYRHLHLTLATLAILAPAAVAEARGGPHEATSRALSAPVCGWSGGALADPARTQACLAERFKAAKQKPVAKTDGGTTPASAPVVVTPPGG